MSLLEEIDSLEYLFLDKLIEVNDHELILFLDEGRVDKDTEQNLNEILEKAPSIKIHPVISDERCRKYKVIFADCLAYSVKNETFSTWTDEETFSGNLFRKYSKSRYLDYLKISTNMEYARAFMGEEYFHFGICCENQIIDVSSAKEPLIERI